MLTRPEGDIDAGTELTLEEYLALPADTRAEIIDGVVRPMTRSDQRARLVQAMIWRLLLEQAPAELRVFMEEVVVLLVDPANARFPDVSVVLARPGEDGRTNNTAAREVVLAVEVVSPTSRTADRREKPVEYALAGIRSFWRVEMDPDIEVIVHRLDGAAYVETGRFGRGDSVTDIEHPWVAVEVTPLLGYFA